MKQTMNAERRKIDLKENFNILTITEISVTRTECYI